MKGIYASYYLQSPLGWSREHLCGLISDGWICLLESREQAFLTPLPNMVPETFDMFT